VLFVDDSRVRRLLGCSGFRLGAFLGDKHPFAIVFSGGRFSGILSWWVSDGVDIWFRDYDGEARRGLMDNITAFKTNS
jgi:hypothetical protein